NLAISVNNHAAFLAEAGRRAEALDTSSEAVQLRRELVDLNRDAYLPNLAISVNNHAAFLAEAGRRAEALNTSSEAVQLYRELVDLNRDAHLPDLARSLWAVGRIALILEDRELALSAIQAVTEAVHIYAELATAEPDPFTPLRDAAAETLDRLSTEQ
ncbi:tetratricopeptide repeat protein, partial [Micromonospora sp. NPDC000316]